MQLSGKLVVSSIVTIAILLAGASWWFRYNATHRAVEFWGADVASRIRDAKKVSLTQVSRDSQGFKLVSYTRDVSAAPGLTHLRTALLEDKSFEWPSVEIANCTPWGNSTPYGWELDFFGESQPHVHIYFSVDPKFAYNFISGRKCRRVSCAPISKGLLEVFTEMISAPMH